MPTRVLSCVILLCCTARGQTPVPSQKIAPVNGIQVLPIAGAPFTAQEEILLTRRVNGEDVTTEARATVARDAQGRVHMERHAFHANVTANFKEIPNQTIVIDPVEATVLECAVTAKLCDLRPLTAYDPVPFDLSGEEAAAKPAAKQVLIAHGTRTMTIEALGEAEMQGLVATGSRRTVKSVPGVEGGDDPPLSVVEESWRSTSLQVPISAFRKSESSTQVETLGSISPADPDPDLFLLQVGFTVRDHRDGSHDIEGTVTAPVAIRTVDPEFSQEAQQTRVNANVLMKFVVDSKGIPQNIQVARRAGEGLDEKAVAALKQYRFKPATLNGRPVPVSMYVETSFVGH
jgi:TonB family protein